MTRTMRDYGTGSVSPHGDGYRARLPAKYGRRNLGVYPTEEEATGVLDEALRELEAAPPSIGITVAKWFGDWLDARKESGDYRAWATERARFRAYIETSCIGNVAIADVVEADVREWMGKVKGKGGRRLAGQTRSNALSLLRCGFEAARERGLRHDNPARDVRLPKGAHAKKEDGWTWLKPGEIGSLLATCDRDPFLWRMRSAIFTLAICSGLRAGELWGLRDEEDVDTEAGALHVRRSYDGPTKKGQSRVVRMIGPVRKAIEGWRKIRPRSHAGLLFPARDGGCHSVGYDAGLGVALKAAGIARRVRFHDLRHTCASHLLQGTWAPGWVERAMRIEEVCGWLGHSDIKVTQRYAHLCMDGVRALVRTGHDLDTDLSHLRDLNPGPTVYEVQGTARPGATERPDRGAVSRSVASLLTGYLEAVERGDPLRDRLGVDAAVAALEVVTERVTLTRRESARR